MTFPIIFSNTGKRYRKAFRYRTVRDVSTVLIFIVPFLAIYRIELLYLTLIPWITVGAIYIYNYSLGNGHSDLEPIGLRDWCIEVDQYPSFSAAMNNDRFIEMASIQHVTVELFEGETFFQNGHRPEPRSEMRRVIFRTVDGSTYSIDRPDRSIRNLIRALDAWNESRTNNSVQMFEERRIVTNIECGREDVLGRGGGSNRRRNMILLGIGISTISFVALMALMSSPDWLRTARTEPFLFTFFCFAILFITVVFLFDISDRLEAGLKVPTYVRPVALQANQDALTFFLEGGWMISFPWSSIRGLMASSTEEYPHPITMDSLFYNDRWGAVVFDGYLIYLRKGIADDIRSAFVEKFGFAPQQFWYAYHSGGRGGGYINDYSLLQNRHRP
jgi:hypothetical protein